MNVTRSAIVGLVSSLALVGCPVDDRELIASGGSSGRAGEAPQSGSGGTGGRAGSGGSGGSPDSSATDGGDGGRTDPGVNGGQAGEDGGTQPYPPLIGGCVDLDQDGVPDCSQSVVQNSSFKLDSASWAALFGATLSWSDANAYDDLPSGVAKVAAFGAIEQDGLASAAAVQCVPISSGTKLAIFASLYIPSGQGEGLGGITLFLYDKADCMGSIKDSFDNSIVSTDSWTTLSGSHVVADGVSSMQVRLTVTKPYRSASFEVRFDNVLVKAQ
ncbi:MAG TPA: hypothetical protein VEQ58_16205 [Polyangiaceae bacterium]|nr:hypothetical protein [Polyangiaceae bacterium]